MSEIKTGGVILNPSCDNNCVFCGRIPKISDEKLKAQEIKVSKNLVQFRRQSINYLEISGSDPIEYGKIVPLIRYAKRIGFNNIQLSTHGKRLADSSFLNDLISSGITKLRIPIYGSNAKIHDSVTRSEGSFDAVVEGIKNLLEKSQNIAVQISCMVLQQNKDDLINIIDLVKELDIIDFYFSVPCFSNNDSSYCLPFKKLGPYIKEVYDYAARINYPIRFMEIPFCVFGDICYDDALTSIDNQCGPPDLGDNCQPPEKYKTSMKDIPSYRVKKKVGMCKDCKCMDFCDGFFVNDINKFGTGKLKPIN
ncbi:MAG: radical SAM protein [Nanoarchaeota archaeon]|nr:radical SAM protein [Nanoarchaeota archaeon]